MSEMTLQIRRHHARLRLGIEAGILGFDGPQRVILYDLSETGAKILLQQAWPISKGILAWLDYEAFGDIAWRKGRWCGMRFDKPISEQWLIRTRAASPGMEHAAKEKLLKQAEEFVGGRGRCEMGM